MSSVPAIRGGTSAKLDASRRLRVDLLKFLVVPVALMLAVCLSTYRIALDGNVAGVSQRSGGQIDFIAMTLDSALDKYAYLPELLTLQPDVHALLRDPGDRAIQQRLNQWLSEMNGIAHAAVVYLLDERGVTIAASNYREPGSFVGQDYSFRPYYQRALKGDRTPFYAIGATTGEPGCFLAVPIVVGGTRGVAVVKVSLGEVETAWARSGAAIALADEHGVLFLSSVSEWRYRSLAPLSAEVARKLKETRQYGTQSIDALPDASISTAEGAQRVDLPIAGQPAARRGGAKSDTLVLLRSSTRSNWRVVMFAPLEDAHGAAFELATTATLGAALLWLAIVSWHLRKRGIRAIEASRVKLQQAHAELENRIQERTKDLTQTNVELETKLQARAEAERVLRTTQNELVQAGKIGLLGQMAAEVCHELNQPLTAMRALCGNSQELLARQLTTELAENLSSIEGLSDRMGDTVNQLRGFAWRSDGPFAAVRVNDVVDDALLLVRSLVRAHGAALEREGSELQCMIKGDRVRLGQVFVNLIRNAIEAMSANPATVPRLLRVAVSTSGANVEVLIQDSGPGIAADAMNRLFEPFFTSKAAGAGLGLGLSISKSIVNAMGGELKAGNLPGQGAEFRVALPLEAHTHGDAASASDGARERLHD